ncbi:Arylesterase precursor [Polystyrenella longa]|uniref:Arylesterase n=2 Tax=Polystyrenella longa TaxID=2528007 RepID=A0A518CNR3_9PLAN|nr:Arylesterase precursor [Polystyrenella longa]
MPKLVTVALFLMISLGVLFSLLTTNANPTSNEKQTDVRIVVLGDSITKGVRTGVAATEIYRHLIEQELSTPEHTVEVLNEGIGGERTDQAIKRLQKTVIDRNPDIVTVMYGTNDSYVDQGKTESRLSVEEYRSNLEKIVEQMKQAGITVVLMTEPRWGSKAANGLGENPNVRLEKYMDACRKVAEKMGVSLVDNYSAWKEAEDAGANLSSWTTDECHPNPKGHEKLATTIVPVVRPLVENLKQSAVPSN